MRYLNNLEPRERMLVIVFGIFLTGLAIFSGLRELFSWRHGVSVELQEAKDNLVSLESLLGQVLSSDAPKKLPKSSTVFRRINNLLNQNNMQPVSINERKSGKNLQVEIAVRLQNILMLDFLNFLSQIEYVEDYSFTVTKLRIRRDVKKDEQYSISFSVILN